MRDLELTTGPFLGYRGEPVKTPLEQTEDYYTPLLQELGEGAVSATLDIDELLDIRFPHRYGSGHSDKAAR